MRGSPTGPMPDDPGNKPKRFKPPAGGRTQTLDVAAMVTDMDHALEERLSEPETPPSPTGTMRPAQGAPPPPVEGTRAESADQPTGDAVPEQSGEKKIGESDRARPRPASDDALTRPVADAYEGTPSSLTPPIPTRGKTTFYGILLAACGLALGAYLAVRPKDVPAPRAKPTPASAPVAASSEPTAEPAPAPEPAPEPEPAAEPKLAASPEPVTEPAAETPAPEASKPAAKSENNNLAPAGEQRTATHTGMTTAELRKIPIDVPPKSDEAKSMARSERKAAGRELLKKAALALKDDDLRAAEEHVRKALTYDPYGGSVAAEMALVMLKRNEPLRAWAWARRATKMSKHSADVFVVMGDVEQALGRTAAAEAAYDRALELEPDHKEAAQKRFYE